MSFVKKAVKKVFKGIKKIVKSKIFKYVAIAAAIFFTAGVAAGGFAAFAAAGNAGIAGFFTAVGQTMATGAAAIAGGLGAGGLSAGLAAHGGAAAVAAANAGVLTGAAAAAAGAGAGLAAGVPSLAGIAAGGATVGAGGTLASAGGVGLGGAGGYASFLATATGPQAASYAGLGGGNSQLMLAAVNGGMQMVAKNKNKQKYPNGFVAGGVARGGSDVAPDPFSYEFGDAPSNAPQTAAAEPLPIPSGAPQDAPAMETQMPQGLVGTGLESPVHPGIQRIRDRLAARDNPNQNLFQPTQYQGLTGAPWQPEYMQDQATDINGLLGGAA